MEFRSKEGLDQMDGGHPCIFKRVQMRVEMRQTAMKCVQKCAMHVELRVECAMRGLFPGSTGDPEMDQVPRGEMHTFWRRTRSNSILILELHAQHIEFQDLASAALLPTPFTWSQSTLMFSTDVYYLIWTRKV